MPPWVGRRNAKIAVAAAADDQTTVTGIAEAGATPGLRGCLGCIDSWLCLIALCKYRNASLKYRLIEEEKDRDF